MLCCLLHRPRYHLRNQCVSGHVDRSEAWENAVQGLGKRQRNPRYLVMPDLHLTDVLAPKLKAPQEICIFCVSVACDSAF